MNIKTRATAEYTRTGQERPYGDNVTEAIVTIESSSPYSGGGEWRQVAVGEIMAKRLAKALIWWEDNSDDPFAPMLDSFDVIGEGGYRVRTRSRYND